MKKFLIGLLTGIVLTGLAFVIFAFSLIRLGEQAPTVADGSTLVISLEGDIPEKAPVENPLPFFGTPTPVTVEEMWTMLRAAKTDPKIKAVLLVADRAGIGWAKMQEIRQDLVDFKKSGKPLIAFLRSAGTREYYLATAADEIFVSPEEMIDVKGLRAELSFYKSTLDKLGVQFEVEHIGRYKDFGDTFTKTGMSPETSEVMNNLLDNIYGHLVQTIAQGRKKTPEQVRAIIDQGPFTAKQAKQHGLVDQLYFEDQVYGVLKKRLGQSEIKKLSHRTYARYLETKDRGGKQIAWIVGEGAIMRGSGEDAMGSDEGFSSGAMVRMLRRVAADKNIAGVILRIDSPGGDAFASDEILREVKLLRDKKPMVISMSDSAASGGYYVSMTGDPVLAYPNTITGSIGVVYGKVNMRGLYDKLGIQKEVLARGQNATIDSNYVPLTPEGRLKLRSGLEEFYVSFVQKVAESRKRPYDQVEPLAQGRVWLGSEAKKHGLVDELGGIDRSIELIRQKAKIGAGDKIRLVPYPPKRSIWEQYLKTQSENVAEAQIRAVAESKIQALTDGLDWKVWSEGGMMRIMPFRVKIQ